MKVKRLINILKSMPQDAEVKYWWDSAPRSEVRAVLKHHRRNEICIIDKPSCIDPRHMKDYLDGGSRVQEWWDKNGEGFGVWRMVEHRELTSDL